MKTVIFGCGKIAHRVAKGFEHVEDNILVGFGSRDINKAKEYAQKYHVELYGDYDTFLNDLSIDAIYVSTYNLNHYELVKKCLEHHKHVMCEKPMALSVEENNELFEIAKQNNVLLMEALKSVFLPITNKVKDLIKNKVIGDIHHIEVGFIRNGHHGNNHWINDYRCGATKDLGEYCIGTVNYLLDCIPTIKYKYKNNTENRSDTTGELILDYNGINCHVLVSNDFDGDNSLKIYGTDGIIVVENFWKTGKGYYLANGIRYEIDEELISDFHYEIAHFTKCINLGLIESPIMSKNASENIIKITQ